MGTGIPTLNTWMSWNQQLAQNVVAGGGGEVLRTHKGCHSNCTCCLYGSFPFRPFTPSSLDMLALGSPSATCNLEALWVAGPGLGNGPAGEGRGGGVVPDSVWWSVMVSMDLAGLILLNCPANSGMLQISSALELSFLDFSL